MRARTALSALAISMSLGACASPSRAAHAPNIVLVLADDLGWGELGCQGQTRILTPRIDRMASEGLRFTAAYSGSPLCAPSRCTLLTGLHAGHARIRDNLEIRPEGQLPLADEATTLAELLRARGYATAAIGKWGLGGPGSPGEPGSQGFDRFFGYLCQRRAHDHYPPELWDDGARRALPGNADGADGGAYSHDLFTDEALAFVRSHRDEPFFLYLAYAVPHLALQVPEDSLAEYRGRWDDPPYEGGKGYTPHPAPRAAYAAMVGRLDRDVGRLLDLLDELELAEDTLVVFTSDNGPTYDRIGGSDSDFFASSGPFRGRKGSVYEGGIRVPLIARWPGRVSPGGTNDEPCALWDLFPTLCDLGGVPAGDRPPTDGVSLARALAGGAVPSRTEPLYWELRSYGGQQALRDGRWKLVRRGLAGDAPTSELYDLRLDPSETRDLAGEHPDVASRLAAKMEASHVASDDFPLGR